MKVAIGFFLFVLTPFYYDDEKKFIEIFFFNKKILVCILHDVFHIRCNYIDKIFPVKFNVIIETNIYYSNDYMERPKATTNPVSVSTIHRQGRSLEQLRNN